MSPINLAQCSQGLPTECRCQGTPSVVSNALWLRLCAGLRAFCCGSWAVQDVLTCVVYCWRMSPSEHVEGWQIGELGLVGQSCQVWNATWFQNAPVASIFGEIDSSYAILFIIVYVGISYDIYSELPIFCPISTILYDSLCDLNYNEFGICFLYNILIINNNATTLPISRENNQKRQIS